MLRPNELISNSTWREVYNRLRASSNEKYMEIIGAEFSFNPVTDHVMTSTSDLFSLRKAAAMYFWYKNGDRTDTSITKYFAEYKKCTDENHKEFNSNYGYYAYTQKGLSRCIDYLMQHKDTRQACFCINNNDAMSESSIDKLCTNTIQFFIRNDRLEMIVQMRSSNFLTLLPYDAFMFTVFFQHVYSSLRKNKYHTLRTGMVRMQIASLHMLGTDRCKYKPCKGTPIVIDDFTDNNWQNILEEKLLHEIRKDYYTNIVNHKTL